MESALVEILNDMFANGRPLFVLRLKGLPSLMSLREWLELKST